MEQCSKGFGIRATLLLILLFFASACSSFDLIPSDSLIHRLKGRGPVLVSSDNPYLAANLLLQQEAKNSSEFAGFLEKKGYPVALSVSQDFLTPAKLDLFYLNGDTNKSEQYDLELLQDIWVIKGPHAITDGEVKKIISTLNLDPRTSDKSRPKVSNAPELIPLFEERSVDKPIKEEAINDSKKPTVTSGIEEMISQYSSAPAETTPRGDLVHFITSEKETLELIATWYTKTSLTLSRIARANKIAVSANLSPGDQIVIPAELVKNKMRLPEQVVEILSAK